MENEGRYGTEKMKEKLLYENSLRSEYNIRSFIMEGNARVTFPNGRMRMENVLDVEEGQKANYVFWCPVEFPADIRIEWEFLPIREPGLCMLFFAAGGKNGEDLFDTRLMKRTGEYSQYHHGDINAFHVSYFRRKEEEERAFHICNLRKSYGLYLTAQGGDPIPDVSDVKEPYLITVEKKGQQIVFLINGLEIFRFVDDGRTWGPFLGGGKVGFRQLAPMIGEYANLRVFSI